MKYFSSVLKFPTGFSEATRRGSLQRIKLSWFESIKKGIGWLCLRGGRNPIVVSVDKTIKLHAVRLFGSENNEYSVIVKVTDSNGVAMATKTGMFMSKLVQSETRDYQGFDIAFETPIALQAGIQYSSEASISGPPSWYGQDDLPGVEHGKVTFSFANTAGRAGWQETTVLTEQFPEFVFSVN